MDIIGPSMCEANQKTEFLLISSNEEIIIQLTDTNMCTNELKLKDTIDPLKQFFDVLPTIVGQHDITIFGKDKSDQLLQKSFFCYNLQEENWHFEELHGSLEDVHLEIELRLHQQISEYITAQAQNINDNRIIQCKVNCTSKMSLDFSFKPLQYGNYEIKFFCGDQSSKNPCFQIHIIDFSKFKLIHSFITDKCLTSFKRKVSFIFDLSGEPSDYLKAWIEDPNSIKVDMLLYGEEKEDKIGQLRCDFTPHSIGMHSLSVCYGNVMFEKCPLIFHVFNEDLLRIVETVPSLNSSFMIQDTIAITYDCSQCGSGILEIISTIHLNSGDIATVPVEKIGPNNKGIIKCNIPLTLQGRYVIEALYNNESAKHVTLEIFVPSKTEDLGSSKFTKIKTNVTYTRARGKSRESPITIAKESKKQIDYKHTGASLESALNFIQNPIDVLKNDENNNIFPYLPEVFGEGLLHAEIGKVAVFTVNPKEKSGQLTIDAKGPKSLTKCLIRPQPVSGCYNVEYYPNEVGLYSITILWNGECIPNSPFHVPVTDITKIRCINFPEIFNKPLILNVNEKIKIDFDYSKAGNGKFIAVMERSCIETNIRCWGNTNKKIWSFFIESTTEGKFNIKILWNEAFLGRIEVTCQGCNMESINKTCGVIDPTLQVILRGHGLKEAFVGDEAEFIVGVINAGEGELTLSLCDTNNKLNIIPILTKLTTNKEYTCSYKPSISGDYMLSIIWGQKTVKGSPFLVKIRNYEPSQKMYCSGDGLDFGLVGKDIVIDIYTETPLKDENLLLVRCVGPRGNSISTELIKKNLLCYQMKMIIPSEGKYQIDVLYDMVHIHGSPFYPVFSNEESLAKITVSGPGLSSLSLNEVDSHFIVDTRQAGLGKLTVQVKGPQESFHVEVQKDTNDERIIHCSYNPIMTGQYTITIRWNGILICGSPFNILLS